MILFGEPKPPPRPTPGEHVLRLPESAAPGGDAFSALDLKRFAQAALGRLGALGVDVDVSSLQDGRVSLALAPAWAELFLANLEAQAQEFKWRLHRARCEATIREAETQAQLRQARERAKVEDTAIRAEYGKLLAAGLSHREAIRELKRLAGGRLTATEIGWIVARKEKKAKPICAATDLDWITTRKGWRTRPREKAKPTARRPPTAPTPDSPDQLVRLWAETPPPTPPRFEGTVVRWWWTWKKRRLSWRRASAKKGMLPARALWAAFCRDQAWHYLWRTFYKRHQLREMRYAVQTGCSLRTGILLHPIRLRGLARELEDHGPREERYRAHFPREYEAHEAKRKAESATGLSWLKQRWLAEAEALAQLRAHGVTG